MSLVPAFEIGVWNAWILMLYTLLHGFLLSLIFKNVMKKTDSPADIPYNRTELRARYFQQIILILLFIYSVFLPLEIGTLWFYLGISFYLAGLIAYTIVMVNWATSPIGKPVIGGIYQYSRHPQYLTQNLIFIGVGIASASWLFLLLAIILITLMNILAVPEERFCCAKYGDAYREYMNTTPRWIGIPKSGSSRQP